MPFTGNTDFDFLYGGGAVWDLQKDGYEKITSLGLCGLEALLKRGFFSAFFCAKGKNGLRGVSNPFNLK